MKGSVTIFHIYLQNKNLDNNIRKKYYIKVLFSLEPTPSASKLDL
jgi:hypothetical protein